MEIEPWAMKTLLLLQSKSEDAPYRLREMLIETIQLKYGGKREYRPVPPVPSSWIAEMRAKKLSQDQDELKRISQTDSPASPTLDSNSTSSSDSAEESNDNVTIEMVEDGLSCIICCETGSNPYDLLECAECHAHYHKECHSPPVSEVMTNDPRVVWYCRGCSGANKMSINPVLDRITIKYTDKSATVTHNSSPTIVGFHFGTNLGASNKQLVEGKTCVVCSEIGNSRYDLFECAGCHSHYHKECHSPPASEMMINDPRVSWYCRRCSGNNQLDKTSLPGSVRIKYHNKSASMKVTHNTSSSTVVNKQIGGFVTPNKKNIMGKCHVPNLVSSHVKGTSPTINIISADKRLQIMKKNAAKKKDKRSLLK